MAQKNPEELDPEMIENLELLLSMDVLEEESSWDAIENLENVDPDEEGKELSDET